MKTKTAVKRFFVNPRYLSRIKDLKLSSANGRHVQAAISGRTWEIIR